MKRILSVFLILVLAVSLCGFKSFGVLGYNGIEVKRISGVSRIDTSIAISDEGWKSSGAKTVVLVNGYGFADALSGASLAAALNAPILLTSGESLENSVKQQLKALKCSEIYILGGNLSVSQQIENELLNSGYSVKRVSGQSRSETAAKIANELYKITDTKPESVFLVSGESFPDALSVSPVAGIKGLPILYAESDGSLNESVKEYIESSECTSVVIAGGEISVPKSVTQYISDNLSSIKSVERISGISRYETSLKIYEKYRSVFNGAYISVATGENFPDALSGSALASKHLMPVVLVNNSGDNAPLRDEIVKSGIKKIYIFGGENSVSKENEFFISGVKLDEHHVIRTITISGYSCGIYSDAGTEFKRLGTLTKGQKYTVLDTKDDKNGVSWFKINTGTVEGYVIRTNVTIKNSYTPIEDKTFSESNKAIIYLSPSRQPGNLYYNKSTNEQAEMEKITRAIKDIFDAEYDCTVYIAKTETPLLERCEEAYDLRCDIYIAIHSNASSSSGMYGTACGARMYHFTNCNQSYQLSKNLVESLGKIAPRTSTSSEQIFDGMLYLNNFGYGEVRNPADYGMVSLLAETDYHDNYITGAWIINNTQQIARAYVDGIVKTFNIPKK